MLSSSSPDASLPIVSYSDYQSTNMSSSDRYNQGNYSLNVPPNQDSHFLDFKRFDQPFNNNFNNNLQDYDAAVNNEQIAGNPNILAAR